MIMNTLYTAYDNDLWVYFSLSYLIAIFTCNMHHVEKSTQVRFSSLTFSIILNIRMKILFISSFHPGGQGEIGAGEAISGDSLKRFLSEGW